MERKTANAIKRPKGARERPTLAGILRLTSLASRARPALTRERMVSLMQETLKEVQGLEGKEAFKRIYRRGEGEIKSTIFSKLKIPKGDAELLFLALGGPYSRPDANALSRLVKLRGAGKVRYWLSMFARMASNELPAARRVAEGIRFGSDLGRGKAVVSTELVVTDMFVQPLITYCLVARMILPGVDALRRTRKKPS